MSGHSSYRVRGEYRTAHPNGTPHVLPFDSVIMGRMVPMNMPLLVALKLYIVASRGYSIDAIYLSEVHDLNVSPDPLILNDQLVVAPEPVRPREFIWEDTQDWGRFI